VYTTANSLLTDDHVYATLYDKDGGLWVGTLNGNLLYKPASNLPPRYYPIHDVQAMTQLASGQIAVGTAFGLKLITPGSDEVKELNYAPSGVTDVNPFVNHLLMSGMELWIATDGGGVYIYHLAKHESRQITTANGLPSNYVRSLAKGRDGRIWIATIEGLSFVKPEEPGKVVNVNYCYGLNCEYSRGAAQNMPDGDIIFGTTSGAIIVHPENVQSVNYTAKLVILGVDCDTEEERLQTEDVMEGIKKGELHLSYRQRTFELLFESVNMRNHYDIAYRYRMENGEWSQPTDQQYIRFIDVEPGKHKLTLQCVSRTSGTVIDSLTLTISISQPWWNTWWMWCVYVALLLIVFYGAWRVYQLHEKYMRLTIDHLQMVESEPRTMQHSEPVVVQSQTESQDSSESVETSEAVNDFVEKATGLIVEHLSDSEFNIDRLCREMAMSRTLFYVKLKSYTGKSPQDFIRIIRLERAASMLRGGRNVTDVAALTGFDNPKYFSTVFKKYFGVSPSKYH
jgi:AraC-like DNA-binding protein